MATVKKIPVKLGYDYWGEDGTRHKAGTVIDLPVKDAKALLEASKAERADPLPE